VKPRKPALVGDLAGGEYIRVAAGLMRDRMFLAARTPVLEVLQPPALGWVANGDEVDPMKMEAR
jgi:hypothetical protein